MLGSAVLPSEACEQRVLPRQTDKTVKRLVAKLL